ncbi:hypothetical protein PV326_003857 [Microctonus aethiopoides]|nr:hypothetical protein PV326_003857 [Microctonus aethiopoides]
MVLIDLTCNPPEPHTRALLGSLRMEGSSDRKHVEDVTLGPENHEHGQRTLRDFCLKKKIYEAQRDYESRKLSQYAATSYIPLDADTFLLSFLPHIHMCVIMRVNAIASVSSQQYDDDDDDADG